MGPDGENPDSADGTDADAPGSAVPGAGRIRRQEPGTTRPRPPTVGESRARDKARREREELEIQAAETAAREEQRRRTRRKAMIGGAAVVGVVGLVALGYTVLSSESESVTATCVDEQGVAVPDDVCSSAGSPNSMGMFIVAGSSYRYYYGGSNTTVGQKPVGGSTVKPQGVTVKTKSGTTIQRGGFGSKVSGTSGGS